MGTQSKVKTNVEAVLTTRLKFQSAGLLSPMDSYFRLKKAATWWRLMDLPIQHTNLHEHSCELDSVNGNSFKDILKYNFSRYA